MKQCSQSIRGWLKASAMAGALALGAVAAQAEPFAELGSFEGRLGASSESRGPIVPGSEVLLGGRGLTPGQQVTLRQNGEQLGETVSADENGEFRLTVTIPEDAAPGAYPVVAEFANPAFATTFDVRVAPVLGPIGVEDFTVDSHKGVRGLYQVAEAPELNAVYVAAANGRPPVTESYIAKLDIDSLEVLASVSPAEAPEEGSSSGSVFAAYGIGVDEIRGQVWVTNTRQDTVAVYAADDLSLIKQFDSGTVSHARDVVLYGGEAYVSATFTPNIAVFDADSLELVDTIEIQTGQRGETFGTASLSLDAEAGKLVVAGLGTSEVAVLDLGTGEQKVFHVPGAERVIGVAEDTARNRIYTANSGSDDVSILDAETGELIKSVPVGSGPLNVAVDPESGLAYVAVRGSGTVVVINADGEVVGNLDVGTFPNHLAVDSKGGVLVVNKRSGDDDPKGDLVTRITPKM
ncbi:YncE family protein [Pseudooceanicola sp. HF7]|uniref:YncE family protein n=1 Tax=Pseudooceanicola sp. HF7 TaxID=2721560 RepID=UPI00142FE64F|nr:ATP-binding protein [Pseudooceanicola sp. HF7]NIZ10887.1 ATP-binding protein [Pseudooceanicola sp. HF7]